MALFKRKKTINDMCDAYLRYAKREDLKGMRTILSNLRYIRESFGNYSPDKIKPKMVDEFVTNRLSKSAKNTVRRDIAVFHSLVNQFIKSKEIEVFGKNGEYTKDYADCKKLLEIISYYRPPKVIRKVVLSLDHLKRILAHLPESMERMTTAAYMLGWRHDELAKLLWRHVDFFNKEVILEDSKSGIGRKSLMYGKLFDFFKSIHNGQDLNEKVFEKWNYHTWRKACIRAGFVDANGKALYRLHDCRKLAVRYLSEQIGLDADTICDVFTGHTNKDIFLSTYNLRNADTYINYYRDEVLSK